MYIAIGVIIGALLMWAFCFVLLRIAETVYFLLVLYTKMLLNILKE